MNDGHRYHDSIFLNALYDALRMILGPIVRAIWVRSVQGIEHIPKEGASIVAFNHQSYFDFLCFIAVSPRKIHYLSAEKFFTNPFWLPLMRATGQIRVERLKKDKRDLHELVRSHLEHGKLIGIFPEGTRAPKREEMLEAYSGVARYAFHGNVPVIPVGIRGTYDVMSRFDRRPRFQKTVDIIVGEPVDFSDYRRAKLTKKAFKILTNKIMTTISQLSGKTYPYKLYPPWPHHS